MVGERNADSTRDYAAVGDVISNEARYGNCAAVQRVLADWAAAIAGKADLQAALDWNWSHTTPASNSYGWNDVIEEIFIMAVVGETIESRERQSVCYGLFAWSELLMIADVPKHAGYGRTLFTDPDGLREEPALRGGRASDFDNHLTAWNALLAAGPRGRSRAASLCPESPVRVQPFGHGPRGNPDLPS